MKEKEQNVYLDGIKQLVQEIRMERKSHGDVKVRRDDIEDAGTSENKPRLLTKPAKVPVWTKDITLETYTKQINAWSTVLKDIPEHVKYADLVESLKTNKEIK